MKKTNFGIATAETVYEWCNCTPSRRGLVYVTTEKTCHSQMKLTSHTFWTENMIPWEEHPVILHDYTSERSIHGKNWDARCEKIVTDPTEHGS
jgi:hypothetical protein